MHESVGIERNVLVVYIQFSANLLIFNGTVQRNILVAIIVVVKEIDVSHNICLYVVVGLQKSVNVYFEGSLVEFLVAEQFPEGEFIARKRCQKILLVLHEYYHNYSRNP